MRNIVKIAKQMNKTWKKSSKVIILQKLSPFILVVRLNVILLILLVFKDCSLAKLFSLQYSWLTPSAAAPSSRAPHLVIATVLSLNSSGLLIVAWERKIGI